MVMMMAAYCGSSPYTDLTKTLQIGNLQGSRCAMWQDVSIQLQD